MISIKKNIVILSVLIVSLLFFMNPSLNINRDNNKAVSEIIHIPKDLETSSENGGGYEMDTNAPFSWIEINETGTRLDILSNNDDESDVITLEWNFPYYENNYDRIYVSSNGWMTFSNLGNVEDLCYSIPSLEEENVDSIALLCINLDPSQNGDVFFNFSGSSPNRYLVIEFYNVSHKNGNFVGSFESILYENGTILFQYKELHYFDNYIIGLDHGDGINYNNFDEFTGLPIESKAIYFNTSSLIPVDYSLGVEENDEFSWLVTHINNGMMNSIFGINWELNYGLQPGISKNDKIKINITSIADNSTHWLINYSQWGWTNRDLTFEPNPTANDSLLFRQEPLNYTFAHNFTNLFPFIIPKPSIVYLRRALLSNYYDYPPILESSSVRLLHITDPSVIITAQYNAYGILDLIKFETKEDKEIIFGLYNFYDDDKPSFIGVNESDIYVYGVFHSHKNDPLDLLESLVGEIPIKCEITIDFIGGYDPNIDQVLVIYNKTEQNSTGQWKERPQIIYHIPRNLTESLLENDIIQNDANWTYFGLIYPDEPIPNITYEFYTNGFKRTLNYDGQILAIEYIYTSEGLLSRFSWYFNGKEFYTWRLNDFDYQIDETSGVSDSGDGDNGKVRKEDNLIFILFFTGLIGLALAISATSVYYYEQKNKKEKLARDLAEEPPSKTIFVVKSAKDILEDLGNKYVLLQIFDELYPKYERSNLEQLKLTLISEEFLDKVDQLGFDERNKTEFLKEMLALSQKERNEIVDNIIKRLNSDKI